MTNQWTYPTPVTVNGPELAEVVERLNLKVSDLKKMLADTAERKQALADEVAAYKLKWSQLNVWLNDKADEMDLCSQYDDELSNWNRGEDRKFQLEARRTEDTLSFRVEIATMRPRRADELCDSLFSDDIAERVREILENEGHEDINVSYY